MASNQGGILISKPKPRITKQKKAKYHGRGGGTVVPLSTVRPCHSAGAKHHGRGGGTVVPLSTGRPCHYAGRPGCSFVPFFWSLPKSCLKLSLVQTWIFGILEALLSLKERAKKGVQVLNGKG